MCVCVCVCCVHAYSQINRYICAAAMSTKLKQTERTRSKQTFQCWQLTCICQVQQSLSCVCVCVCVCVEQGLNRPDIPSHHITAGNVGKSHISDLRHQWPASFSGPK